MDEYGDDWNRLAWVQLLGRVDVVAVPGGAAPEAVGAAGAVDALAAKYEQYAARRPPGPLLRLTVERVLDWRAAG